jgi:predicted aminopeptidase
MSSRPAPRTRPRPRLRPRTRTRTRPHPHPPAPHLAIRPQVGYDAPMSSQQLTRVFVLLSALLLSSCSSIGYLAESGIGQWKLFNRARPVEDVLKSPRTPEATREAIRVVRKAKDFAVELGLKATSNYTSFVQLEGPCVLWAVSASHPVQLEQKKWHFPIVGSVPYLGFFKKASAENEAKDLEKESPVPDTWVRCVPAFSSLGWFSDPLYSSMLKGKERDIAELVIHESLHATVWVNSSVEFNEKLANFVGLEGSLRYVDRYQGHAALEDAKKVVAGEKLFGDFLHDQVETYKKTVTNLEQKAEFYGTLRSRYEEFLAAQARKGVKFTKMDVRFSKWNNAALLAAANYYSDYTAFENLLKSCGGDLGRFVRWIAAEQKKEAGRFKSGPEQYLVDLVKGASCPQ